MERICKMKKIKMIYFKNILYLIKEKLSEARNNYLSIYLMYYLSKLETQNVKFN
jgi:hypothetical protein